MDLLNLSFLLAYFVIVLAIGFWSSRKQSGEDFLIANRDLPWWKIGLSNGVGTIGAGLMTTVAAMSFLYGFSVLWAAGGAFLGFISFAFLSKKLKRLGDEKKFYTLPDYFYHKWGKTAGIIVTILTFIMFFSVLITQFVGGGIILTHISGLSYLPAVLISGAAILIYLSAGGFRAVIRTDIFQYAAMFLLFLLLFFSLRSTVSTALSTIFESGLVTNISFAILGFFTIFSSADIWQRVYAAKSEKDNKKGLVFSGIMFSIICFSVILLGILARAAFPNINSNDALVTGLFQIAPALFGVSAVIVFAAFMSSIDTYLFVAAMSVSKDMASRYKRLSSTQLVWITRLVIFVLSLIAISISLIFNNIQTLFILSLGLLLVLSPIALGSFFYKLKRKAVISCMLVSSAYLAAIVILGLTTPEAGALVFLISAAVLGIGQLFFKK